MSLSRSEVGLPSGQLNDGSRIGNGGLSVSAPLEVIKHDIRDAFDAKAGLMVAGRFDAFRNLKGRAFLDEVLRDDLFMLLFKESRRLATSVIDNDDFEVRVRGATFELMTELYLSSFHSFRIPVMGTVAANVQSVLKPERGVNDFGLGQVGVPGQSLYDGFMIVSGPDHEPRVEGLIEATLITDWQRNHRKQRQVRDVGNFCQDLGGLASENPYLVMITPKPDDKHTRMETATWVDCQLVEPAYVPVSSGLLMAEFMPYVFKQHQDSRGKTLAQARDRWLSSREARRLKEMKGEPSRAFYSARK